MHRGVRQIVLTFEHESEAVAMPGWYCDGCDEGIHTPEDMATSDRVLAELKLRASSRRSARRIDA